MGTKLPLMADVAAKIAAYFHRRGYALRLFRGSTRLFATRLNISSQSKNDRNAVHMREKEGSRGAHR